MLLWWGHMAHGDVRDEIVDRVQERVLDGMGLVVLHSGHFSKLFKRLMGTSCDLKWREADERERLWVVAPGPPDRRRPAASTSRSSTRRCTASSSTSRRRTSWCSSAGSRAAKCSAAAAAITRGHGRIFYFRPGHETYPTYHQPQIQQVIANAVRWAAPTEPINPKRGRMEPLERIG